MNDYFTPYLTITAILTVARANGKATIATAVNSLEIYIDNLPYKSQSFQAWHNIALPALRGCLAYLDGDNQSAGEYLEPIYAATRLLGHSDEQRSIFPKTYLKAKKSLS